MNKLFYPRPLQPGDTVALTAPSSPVPAVNLKAAIKSVKLLGLNPVAVSYTHLALSKIFSSSRSHCIVAPEINTDPSSAYCTLFSTPHAMVVISPLRESTGSSPVLTSINPPVPYVFLASPFSKNV